MYGFYSFPTLGIASDFYFVGVARLSYLSLVQLDFPRLELHLHSAVVVFSTVHLYLTVIEHVSTFFHVLAGQMLYG